MFKAAELFNLKHSLAGSYLARVEYPWQILREIRNLVLNQGEELGTDYRELSPGVWAHRTACIAPTAYIAPPCIIGPGSEVRHCAFIRGNALVGAECVVGNSVELKNVILFDEVQVPHFNYVGDSILGYKAHLGAGAVTSNLKLDGSSVTIVHGVESIQTGLRKMGAILGDHAEVGCNGVLNPGTVIGKNTVVYPGVSVRGVIPGNSIVKGPGEIVRKELR